MCIYVYMYIYIYIHTCVPAILNRSAPLNGRSKCGTALFFQNCAVAKNTHTHTHMSQHQHFVSNTYGCYTACNV